MPEQNRSQWHLSREVPLSIVAGMIVQVIGFAWYASALTAQVDQNTKDIARLEAANDARNSQATQIGDRVIRIEERLLNFGTTLEKIDATLERYLRAQEGPQP